MVKDHPAAITSYRVVYRGSSMIGSARRWRRLIGHVIFCEMLVSIMQIIRMILLIVTLSHSQK